MTSVWVPFVLIFVQPTYCISVCCLWSPNDHRWQPVMELEPMSLLIIYPAYSRCFLAINLNGKLFSIYRLFHKYISSKVSRLISQNSAQIPQPQRYRVHALFDRISKYKYIGNQNIIMESEMLENISLNWWWQKWHGIIFFVMSAIKNILWQKSLQIICTNTIITKRQGLENPCKFWVNSSRERIGAFK